MKISDKFEEMSDKVVNSLSSYSKEIIDELIHSSALEILLRYTIDKIIVQDIDLSER